MVFLKADIRTRRMGPWAYRDSFILLPPTAQLGLALGYLAGPRDLRNPRLRAHVVRTHELQITPRARLDSYRSRSGFWLIHFGRNSNGSPS